MPQFWKFTGETMASVAPLWLRHWHSCYIGRRSSFKGIKVSVRLASVIPSMDVKISGIFLLLCATIAIIASTCLYYPLAIANWRRLSSQKKPKTLFFKCFFCKKTHVFHKKKNTSKKKEFTPLSQPVQYEPID